MLLFVAERMAGHIGCSLQPLEGWPHLTVSTAQYKLTGRLLITVVTTLGHQLQTSSNLYLLLQLSKDLAGHLWARYIRHELTLHRQRRAFQN